MRSYIGFPIHYLTILHCRYERLPPGLLTLTALSRLRFLDTTARVLPPLEPLLELPRLQEVCDESPSALCGVLSV